MASSSRQHVEGIEEWQMASSSSGQHLVESSSSGQHLVDINKLSASTKQKLLMLSPLSSEPCIYSAPYAMRVSNEQHFTPGIVSVGPIHYQNEKLRANEHLKERYLAEFCEHTSVSLEECYKLILDQETRLRNCYADVIELKSENFVKMVLVDAAFLLMILVYHSCQSLLSSTDKLFGNPIMIRHIRYDLLLLENQLPFFILEDLYKLSKLHNILDGDFIPYFGKQTDMASLDHNILEEDLNPIFSEENITEVMTLFCYNFFLSCRITKIPRRQPRSTAVHMLDLLRSYLIPAGWIPERTENEITNLPSLKELHQAGVKIQVGSKENMFDIKFHDGILEVPPLVIKDSTELVFRNVLAFELCHCPEKHIFADYFAMMRLLTLSSEDTELLIKKGVIDNGLPNVERVTTLFNNIIIGTINFWYESPYSGVVKGLNEYCKHDWHKWKATLKQKYFKAPWAICSVSAAVFVIVLTIIQAVFGILQVVLPK